MLVLVADDDRAVREALERALPPLEARGAWSGPALRRPDVRPRLDGRAPGKPTLRADHDGGAPARAVHAQPAPGAAALAHLRTRVGLRLQPLLERPRRLRRLPAAEDRGGRRAAPPPHRPRNRLCAPRAMSLKGRL